MCNNNSNFSFGRSGCNCGCSSCSGCCNNSLFNLLSGNSCGCGCSNGSTWGQRTCRDGCGNIWVRQGNSCGWNNGCGCNNSCGCNNGCGCNGSGTFIFNSGSDSFNNANNNRNDNDNNNNNNRSGNNRNRNNDNFACVTFCRDWDGNWGSNFAQTASGFNGDAYYARQYGLFSNGNNRSGRNDRSCSCGCGD